MKITCKMIIFKSFYLRKLEKELESYVLKPKKSYKDYHEYRTITELYYQLKKSKGIF